MTPFPFQLEGAKFLASRRNALLADEMGLGKTVQAILAARAVGSTDVMVICPASLVSNWRSEFAKWWPEFKCLMVISYDKFARNNHPNIVPWMGTLILDEAHYLKNPSAKRTKAVFQKNGIAETANHVWCLTGTPAPNNPSEFYPMLRHLAPETILRAEKPMNKHQFTHRYCVVRNNGFGEVIVRGQRLDELRERIKPFLLRRTKRTVLSDMPDIRFGDLAFDSKDATRALQDIDGFDVTHLKTALEMKGVEGLQSIAQEMATLRRLTAMAKAPLLAEWVKEWLKATGEKIVLFGVHREPLDLLAQSLSDHKPVVIHGGVPSQKRGAEVVRFQADPETKVFIGQTTAAGTGLTLTAASTLVFLEQSWTPADNAQAAMRIHRIGQKNACLVQTAMLTGSVDEAVQQVLARKLEDLVKLELMEKQG